LSEPAVSVVTLTWNHGQKLTECLASVRDQTLRDWEQIVLDDGSTDGSVEAVERDRDPRVRLVRLPHRGIDAIPERYRRGVSLARGRHIAFLDGDDMWQPRALESLADALEGSDAVLAWGGCEMFGEHTGPLPLPGLARHPPEALENRPVGSAARLLLDPGVTMPFAMIAVLLRRTALERIGGLQVRAGLPVMDHPTLLRLAVEGPFARAEGLVARYRQAASTVCRREAVWIDLGVYRNARRFRSRFGRRVPGLAEAWPGFDAGWRDRLSRQFICGTGLRMLRERRPGRAARLGWWLLRTPALWPGELRRVGAAVRHRLPS